MQLYRYILTSSKPLAWAEIAESDSQLGTNHNTMTWLRPGPNSDWTTLPSYIDRVFKITPMQWMDMWMHH